MVHGEGLHEHQNPLPIPSLLSLSFVSGFTDGDLQAALSLRKGQPLSYHYLRKTSIETKAFISCD